MKSSIRVVALLVLSSLLSGVIGGLIALHFRPGTTSSSLRLNHLDIVDTDGTPRITLGLQKDQAFFQLNTANQVPLIQLTSVEYQETPEKKPVIIPTITLNDQSGDRTILLQALPSQRGLIAFDSPTREGKLLLGNFGTTDDGTDNTLWGMRVSGPNGTGQQIGMASFNGKDTGLVWPGFPIPPLH